MKEYQKFIYIGIVTITLGILFNTVLAQRVGSIGTVFIALGGLFLLIGISKKKVDKES